MAGGITAGQFEEGINLGGGGINFSAVGDMDGASLDLFLTGKAAVWGTTGTIQGTKTLDEITPLTGTKTFEYENHATAGSSTLDWVKVEEVVDDAYRGRIHEFQVQYQNEYSTSEVQFVMQAKTTGEEIYRESLVPFTDTDNKAQELSFRFRTPSDGLVDWGFHILNGVTGAKVRLDDVVITPILREIQETVFIEEEDSAVHCLNSALAMVGFRTRFTLDSKVGSAITFEDDGSEGSRFIIEEDGIYNVSTTIGKLSFSVDFGIALNVATGYQPIMAGAHTELLSTETALTGEISTCSWSGYLYKGDVLSVQQSNTSSAGSYGNSHRFSISKVGSVHAFPALKDQKVEIPTSEIIIRGTSGLGTSPEVDTVQFTTIEKTRGNGLSVSNGNGTIVTALKNGVLSLSATANAPSGTLSLSKNASVADAFPLASEILAAFSPGSGNSRQNISWTGEVKAGDKFRVSNNVTQGADTYALFSCHFFETEVSVAVNNIEPQYGDEDSYLHASGFASEDAGNSGRISFASLTQHVGPAIDYDNVTGIFTALEDGLYAYSFSMGATGDSNIGVYKNTVLGTALGVDAANSASRWGTVSGEVLLEAGDEISNHNLDWGSSTATNAFFQMSKQANPSVIGIDGRPVDAYQQQEDSCLKLSAGTGSDAFVNFGTVSELTGSGIGFQNSNEILINEDGEYKFSGTLYLTGGSVPNVGFFKNSLVYTPVTSDPSLLFLKSFIKTTNEYDDFSFVAKLQKGDIVRGLGGSTITHHNSGDNSFLTVSKIGSLTRSIPLIDSTVDIPTSELRMEGSSSRGTTTESKTVKFDNISEIAGEALSVDNSNGTVLTVLKDGTLSINTSFRTDSTGNFFWITKNTSDASVAPASSEMLNGTISINASFHGVNMGWDGKVKAGDKIRVAAESVPAAGSINALSVLHQETEVAVALSNVTPQFEDVDFNIRLSGDFNTASGNTAVVSMSDVLLHKGGAVSYKQSPVDGDTFTILESGIYNASLSFYTNGNGAVFFTKNASSLSVDVASILPREEILYTGFSIAGHVSEGAWSGYLEAGDIFRVQATVGVQQLNNSFNTFSLAKQALPSIAEVDVTPFVSINKTLTQSIFHSSATSTMLNLTSDLQFSLGNVANNGDVILLIEDDSGGSRTKFIATKKCRVNVNFSVLCPVANLIDIQVNDAIVMRGNQAHDANRFVTANGDVLLETGDFITISASTTLASGASAAYLNITAEAQELERVDNVEVDGEYHLVPWSTLNFWDSTAAAEKNWDTSLLVAQGDSPAFGSSNLLEIDEVTDPATTRIVAKKRIELDLTVNGSTTNTGSAALHIRNSSGQTITASQDSDTYYQSTTANILLEAGDFIYVEAGASLNSRGGGITLRAKVSLTNAVVALPESKTKWQRKVLAAPHTTNNTVPSLTFNNLEPGKTYGIKAQIHHLCAANSSSQLSFVNGSGGTVGAVQQDPESAASTRMRMGWSGIFIATDTTLTSDYVSSTPGQCQLEGDGTLLWSTWVLLEELPLHEQTSQWT